MALGPRSHPEPRTGSPFPDQVNNPIQGSLSSRCDVGMGDPLCVPYTSKQSRFHTNPGPLERMIRSTQTHPGPQGLAFRYHAPLMFSTPPTWTLHVRATTVRFHSAKEVSELHHATGAVRSRALTPLPQIPGP